MKNNIFNLDATEYKLFRQLSSPQKIQDYFDALAINFEIKEETCASPRTVLKRKSAHCIEAAILAASILKFHNQQAFLLDLKANFQDYDHVVCLFKQAGLWGAISKSNHPALRYRDPVYKSVRELAMSYFHEYINKKGIKTLRSFSLPYSLAKYGRSWVTTNDNVWEIANELDGATHFPILPKSFKPRRVGKFEMDVSNIEEWPNK